MRLQTQKACYIIMHVKNRIFVLGDNCGVYVISEISIQSLYVKFSKSLIVSAAWNLA